MTTDFDCTKKKTQDANDILCSTEESDTGLMRVQIMTEFNKS